MVTHLRADRYDDPNWPQVMQGERCRQQGQVDAALQHFNNAIAAFTSVTLLELRVGTFICRGVAHAQLGNTDQAAMDFSEAIRLDPQRGLAYYNRGIARETLGQHALAMADYTDATLMSPQVPDTYIRRGLLLKRQGRTEEARRDFAVVRRMNNSKRTAGIDSSGTNST